jgi:hypothetical protein
MRVWTRLSADLVRCRDGRRYEQQFHALESQRPNRLRKLDVVTDQDAHFDCHRTARWAVCLKAA